MARWLAVGGIAVFAVLLLLLREMRSTEPRPVVARPRAQLAVATVSGAARAAAAAPEVSEPVAAAGSTPAKLDPKSDEFFYKFDEVVPKTLTRNAAKCYEGRHGTLHRNKKLVLKFKTKIVGGVVQVRDVAIKESTLEDAALETCFLQEVQRSTWKDDELPDWEQEDELVLRPERGMKKFWKDNVDYVGAEAQAR